MVAAANATRALRAAGKAFGLPVADHLALRWGVLFAGLDGCEDADYVTSVELVYEGYLFHYRESRVCALSASERETALLAGDFFYARGLRIIAARGDAEGVGLLARLMAACAYLRSSGAPFSADDALWAYTTGGLAALCGGAPPEAVAELFERFDAALSNGVSFDAPEQALLSVRRLGLRDAALLEAELTKGSAASSGAADAGAPAGASSAGAPRR
jgi:hypothetical protein